MISLAKQREVLEEAEKEARGKIIVAMGELSSCRTKIAQVSFVILLLLKIYVRPNFTDNKY